MFSMIPPIQFTSTSFNKKKKKEKNRKPLIITNIKNKLFTSTIKQKTEQTITIIYFYDSTNSSHFSKL